MEIIFNIPDAQQVAIKSEGDSKFDANVLKSSCLGVMRAAVCKCEQTQASRERN